MLRLGWLRRALLEPLVPTQLEFRLREPAHTAPRLTVEGQLLAPPEEPEAQARDKRSRPGRA